MNSAETPRTFHPTSVEDVVQIVKAAAASRRPLYPISTGWNWGYGDDKPPVAGCDIVCLSRMDRIRNADAISTSHPVALIEPGVTQGMLQTFLAERAPGLSFNVTGAPRGTSVLGNALDRGVGYLGPRADDLFSLEIVTGTGQVIHTGFRRLGEDSPLAHCHPWGLGPRLDGLFFQGNFGIVTSGCLKLVVRRPREVALSIRLKRTEDLARFIDEMCALKREGVLSAVAHIGNAARSASTLDKGITTYLAERCGIKAPQLEREVADALAVAVAGDWNGLCSVSGNAAEMRAKVSEVRQRLRGIASVMVVTRERLALAFKLLDTLRAWRFARVRAAAVDTVRPLLGLAVGIPTDAPTENLLKAAGQPGLPLSEFTQSRAGLLYVSPALPMDGRFAESVVKEMVAIAAAHQHALYVTVNVETPTSLVAVTNLLFDKGDPEQVERAHRCKQALQQAIHARGLEIYRCHSQDMAGVVDAADPHWQLLRSFKQVLDPADVVAPGRYNLVV